MTEQIPQDELSGREQRASLGCLFLLLVFVGVSVVSFVRKRGVGETVGVLGSAWELFVTEPLSNIGNLSYWLGHPVGLVYSAILWLVVLEGCGRLALLLLEDTEARFKVVGERLASRFGLSGRLRQICVNGFASIVAIVVALLVTLLMATVIVAVTDTGADASSVKADGRQAAGYEQRQETLRRTHGG